VHLAVYLPFVFSGGFGLSAPLLARRLPPATATWLLGCGALLAAGGTVAALALLGFTYIGQNQLLADQGHWSDSALRRDDPVATPVAVLALTVLGLLLARVLGAIVRRISAYRDAFRLATALPAGQELAVIDHPDAHACAVPGRPGRIVISRGLIRSLNAKQRRALLAHERTHLIHHHHLHHTVAQVAAAANPLLSPLPAAIALSTERWADECAAATSTRDTVVQTLLHTALGMAKRTDAPTTVLAAATTELTARIEALRDPPPRIGICRTAAILGLLVAITGTVLEAAHDTERMFELAQAAYSTTR
jgi:hypothetical protein